ncbi:hypothetical protein B0T16DRAFT_410129 [Cercophora newfieldiana]|uniref:Uncharacterized protein n=1 Tax=Cercophora newfieldiana TaxID=92897 RepID=A0AA40CSX0_9PEZI|nr:hypothetical protein B0T16DRAFT_410129 [Cercophora newfieldiana]
MTAYPTPGTLNLPPTSNKTDTFPKKSTTKTASQLSNPKNLKSFNPNARIKPDTCHHPKFSSSSPPTQVQRQIHIPTPNR